MHNAIMTKPARPHPILGEALTRNQYTTWSGLIIVIESDAWLTMIVHSYIYIAIGNNYNFYMYTVNAKSQSQG